MRLIFLSGIIYENNIIVPLKVAKNVSLSNKRVLENYIINHNDYPENISSYGGAYSTNKNPLFILNITSDEDLFEEKLIQIMDESCFADYSILSSALKYDSLQNIIIDSINISSFIKFFVPILLIIFLSLILTIYIINRKKELGIYIALGKNKIDIVNQLLIEMLLISIIALFSSFPFINMLSDELIDTVPIHQSSIISAYDLYDPTSNEVNIYNIKRTARDNLELQDYIVLSGIILSCVSISVIICSNLLINYQPKDILQ